MSHLIIKKKFFQKVAEQLHQNQSKLFYLLATEAGKTLKDADAEVREAIDFVNYYVCEGEKAFSPRIS